MKLYIKESPEPTWDDIDSWFAQARKKKSKYGRYWVTDCDYLPLHEQPDEGYTKLQAVMRAQREAEEAAKLFNLRIQETAKWFHIMDWNGKICHELDNAI